MPYANRTRLMKLADSEFRRGSDQPVEPTGRATFKGWRLNIAKYDEGWDRRRGSAMRLTGVLLNEDSEALQERVCADESSTNTYQSAADWLAKEAAQLRKAAKMHETVSKRLRAVLERCRAMRTPAEGGAQHTHEAI